MTSDWVWVIALVGNAGIIFSFVRYLRIVLRTLDNHTETLELQAETLLKISEYLTSDVDDDRRKSN